MHEASAAFILLFTVFGVPVLALVFAAYNAIAVLRALPSPRWQSLRDSRHGAMDVATLRYKRRLLIACAIFILWVLIVLVVRQTIDQACEDTRPFCEEIAPH